MRDKNVLREKVLVVSILNLFALSASFYFKQYMHYFILVIPLTGLVGISVVNHYSVAFKRGHRFATTILIVIMLAMVFNLRTVGKRLLSVHGGITRFDRARQYDIAREITKVVPRKSRVAMFMPHSYTYICGFDPPEFRKFGYCFLKPNFLNSYSVARLKEAISSAEFSITTEAYFGRRSEDLVHLVRILEENGFYRIKLVADKYQIWKRA
jgi:hypothetical protein